MSIDSIETQFNNFADMLFSCENPPKHNSMHVNLDYQDDSQFCDFLYDLFCYGYKKKFSCLSLNEITEIRFNIIRDYIKALGADTVLLSYDKNDQDKVVDVKIAFIPYYG